MFSGATPLTSYGHQHTTFRIGDHSVHIDHLTATGAGPGFRLQAALIFVDGVFRGRAWVFGRLGGGGNCYPARARVTEGVCVTVSHGFGAYERLPAIRLEQVARTR